MTTALGIVDWTIIVLYLLGAIGILYLIFP